MVASGSKRKLAFAVAIAFAGMLALLLCYGTRRIRILDSRFHVTSVMLIRGATNRVVYHGDQLVGRARERLAKLRLPVKPMVHATVTAFGTNMLVVAVYGGSFSPQELGSIEAQLVSSSGQIFKLDQGGHSPAQNTNGCLGYWGMNYSEGKQIRFTNTLSYTLRLSLPEGGPRLAEITLGRL